MYIGALISFLSGLFFLYAQLIIVPSISIAGVAPLLLLPWMLNVVWQRDWQVALPVVFIIGLMYDTLNPQSFGTHAFIFIILAVVIDLLRIPFEQDSIAAKLIAIGSVNLIYSLLLLLISGLSWGFDLQLYQNILILFVYNLIFGTIIFGLIQIFSRLRIVVRHE